MPSFDAVWLFLGFFLTLFVLLGYLLGENNFLFRIATYLFIGVAAGYIFVTVIYQVISPRILVPLLSRNLSQMALVAAPLILGLLLLFKLSPRLTGLGNLPMAYLVGVGAAVVIGGAVMGTLITQIRASINLFDLSAPGSVTPVMRLVDGVFILLGTITTLAYFHFGTRLKKDSPAARPMPVEWAARVGQIFIAITLGALFAGVFTATLTALIERLDSLWTVIRATLF